MLTTGFILLTLMDISPALRDQLIAAAHEATKHATRAPTQSFMSAPLCSPWMARPSPDATSRMLPTASPSAPKRNAIFAAVAASNVQPQGKIAIQAIAVVNAQDVPCSPCGACRQVIAEFGRDIVVYYQCEDGMKQSTIAELLPDSFSL